MSAFTIQGRRYYTSIIRDITKARQNEENRQKLLKRLTRIEPPNWNASPMSPRTTCRKPLRMVLNFSQIIAKDYADRLDDDGREYLKIVGDSALRMRDMVHDCSNMPAWAARVCVSARST